MIDIKIILKQALNNNEPRKVCYILTCGNETRQIITDITLFSHEWDAEANCIKPVSTNYTYNQQRINNDIDYLLKRVRYYEESFIKFNLSDLVFDLKHMTANYYVLSFINLQILKMKEVNRFGTALNYLTTYNSLSKFLKGNDITFSDFNENFIERYNVFLTRKGLVKNSISFYMRNLRSVYNKAVHMKIIPKSDLFYNVYTGVDITRKRAVHEEIIKKIYNLNLDNHQNLQLTRDIFLFSYFTRGMAFVDIAFLKRKNFQGDVICYTRRKTGKLLVIKLEPGIHNILLKYKKSNSEYMFPILHSTDFNIAYKEYKCGINTYNRHLKSLSQLIGEDIKLTSYVARHSWATSARNHNVPISVISAGLGHSSEKTTEIYLAMLDNNILDAANNKIISAINDDF